MKTEAAHTPGPWGIEQTEDTNWIGPMRANGRKINQIVVHTNRQGLKAKALAREDANARLIAAAPELLEACKMVAAIEESTKGKGLLDLSVCDLRNAYTAIRAAISKAEGAQ